MLRDLFQPKGRSGSAFGSGAFGSGAFGKGRNESLAATYTETPARSRSYNEVPARSYSSRGAGEARGRGRGRGNRGGSRGGYNNAPKSAEDLDRELAEFMGDEEINVGKEVSAFVTSQICSSDNVSRP